MSLEIKLSPSGDGAEVALPSGHSIRVPLDERTGPILRRILFAQGDTRMHTGIGTAAAPLQSMVEDWLAKGGEVKRPKAPAGSVEIDIDELFGEE